MAVTRGLKTDVTGGVTKQGDTSVFTRFQTEKLLTSPELRTTTTPQGRPRDISQGKNGEISARSLGFPMVVISLTVSYHILLILSGGNISVAAIAGGVSGGILLILTIVMLIYVSRRRRTRQLQLK